MEDSDKLEAIRKLCLDNLDIEENCWPEEIGVAEGRSLMAEEILAILDKLTKS